MQDFSGLIFLGILIFIFYFMLIRPQRRRQEQHRSLIASVEVGHEIITIGGVYGLVRFVGEQDIQLEIAPGTTVRLLKSSIARVLTEEEDEEEEAAEPIELGSEDDE